MPLQTIDRAMQLLTELSRADGMRLVDMQRALSLSKPTAHRLVQSLMQHQLVERAHDAPLYRLGPGMQQLAQRAMPPIEAWHDACRPALRRLAARGHHASLLARIGSESLCVETLGGTRLTRDVLHVGLIHPLGSGSAGVSILGELEDDDVSHILRTVGPRIRRLVGGRPRDVPQEIHFARRHGYAVVPDMLVKGMAGVSVVLHADGVRPIGAFMLLLPSAGLESQRGRELIDSLRRERDWVERELALSTETRWLGQGARLRRTPLFGMSTGRIHRA